jgi:ribonuclease J
VAERRKLSFAGHVGVSLVVDRKGEQMADPDIALTGLPLKDGSGRPFEEAVMNAVLGTLDSIPRPQKRDPDVLAEAVRRAVRAAVAEAWGKKPVCTVFVAVV